MPIGAPFRKDVVRMTERKFSVLLPSGTVNSSGLFTLGTALPVTPIGVVSVYVASGVGLAAGLYDATFNSATECQLVGNPSTTAGSYAGTTSEVVLRSLVIPGGLMGPNGTLEVLANFAYNNTANTKTVKVRYGATAEIYSAGLSSQRTIRGFGYLQNYGSEQLSVVGYINSGTGLGAQNTQNMAYSSVNTAVDQNLEFRGQLATASDYIIFVGADIAITYAS